MFYSILYFYISLQIIKTLEKYSTNFQVNNNINDELNVLLQYIFFKNQLYAFYESKIYSIEEYKNIILNKTLFIFYYFLYIKKIIKKKEYFVYFKY